jgi:hypothetical protein
MHKNLLWQAFLVVVLITTLVYSGIAAYRYFNYSRLTAFAQASTLKWNIQELTDEEFIIEGDYTFGVNNKTYRGKTSWPREPYRNDYAAEKAIEEFSSQNWKIWYDPSNPDHSSLQKKFPLKESISAAFLWALFLYFLWLGYYVNKFKT